MTFKTNVLASLVAVAVAAFMAGPSLSQEMRTVETTWGSAELPVTPQRIYVDGPWTLGNALALGLKPIATTVYGEGTLSYMGAEADDIPQLQYGDSGVAVEKIASLDPDLIVIRAQLDGWNDDRCRAATNVEATYCYEAGQQTLDIVYANLRKLANALNKSDKADQLIAKMDARIAELKARVDAADLEDITVSVLRVRSNRYQFGTVLETVMLKAVGIHLPEAQYRPYPQPEGFDSSIYHVSLENLDAVQADILLIEADTDNDGKLEALQANPLYQTLPAVKNNQVHIVETATWNSFDFIAQNTVLDQIEELIIAPAEQAK